MKISEKFKEGKEQKRSLLIGFITAGDPSIELTPKLAKALVKGGVDIIELGIPFSDPIADGPTIQSSSMRSLSNGTKTKDILDISKKIVEELDVPVILLTYYNTIMKMGIEKFLQGAEKAGISGIVSPDLPPEEAVEYVRLAKSKSINTIFLASPATNDMRLDRIIDSTSGLFQCFDDSSYVVTGANYMKPGINSLALSLISDLENMMSINFEFNQVIYNKHLHLNDYNQYKFGFEYHTQTGTPI